MSIASSTKQTRKWVLDILFDHGWTALNGTAVAQKSFETAVGTKSAHAYLRAGIDEYISFVLSGQYWSEGNDALGNGSVQIPRGADEGKVRKLAMKFAASADAAVAGTYAMRLMRNRITEQA